MILSDYSLFRLCKEKDIIVPYNPNNIQPASIDLELSDEVYYPDTDTLDTFTELNVEPDDFLLVSTKETITVPNNMVARVEGKSSLGRCGLQVHITAGYIDTGFHGKITLEIKNLSHNNIVLHEGCKIAQLCLEYLDHQSVYNYGERGNNYQNQSTVTPSKYKKINGEYHVI